MLADKTPDDFMTPDQTAKFLHIAKRTLENWRALGGGPPYYKLGPGLRSKVVYSRAEVVAWVKNFRGDSPDMQG